MSTALQSARSAHSSDPESELLRQFAQGDLAAFESLFHQYQANVYRWIVRIVRDSSVAEDLTIETFWRVYRSRAHFDWNRSFGAWARRIAVNVAINHLKSVHPENPLTADVAAAQIDTEVQQDIRRQTLLAFQRLPAKLQAVATLALVEDRPYAEIAESLCISVSAVKTRAFRAVNRLRKELTKLGVTP